MSQQVLERPTNSTSEPASKTYPPLTAADRCDAATVRWQMGKKVLTTCGAQAFVRAVMPSGRDLLFCGHCIGENNAGKKRTKSQTAAYHLDNRAELLAQGAVLHSDYHKINLKPTDPDAQTGF